MYAHDTALIATPIGLVRVTGNGERIVSTGIETAQAVALRGNTALVREAARQIAAWFAGERRHFDLPLALAATSRGAALRDGMVAIGYGETMSYGALAGVLSSSPRAIGQACARNPFPIVVPCHRVTNADGSPGAYSAGSGPPTKQWLLDHERRHRMT